MQHGEDQYIHEILKTRPPGNDQKMSSNEGFSFDEDEAFIRSKTSLRMHYEAQVSVIKSQCGDLEKIRQDLGLSARKISQLLMVDPSAWTRWTKKNDEAPPHIWRALQWYLIVRQKVPGLTPQYFIGQDPKTLHEKALNRIEIEKKERLSSENQFKQQISELEKKMSFYKLFSALLLVLSVSLSALLLWKLRSL